MIEAVKEIPDGVTFSCNGARVTRWREGGVDILYPRHRVGPRRVLRGELHACFPNFGSVDEKYGLPKHGPLRDKKGRAEPSNKAGVESCHYDSKRLLGNFFNERCFVSVGVERIARGFVYGLSAKLSEHAAKSVPVSAGFHPYFSTPRRCAKVIANGNEYPIEGLIEKAMVIPFVPMLYIDIPGLGRVQMIMGGHFTKCLTSKIVLWRESHEYLCVEPVLAMPAHFGARTCPHLKPGQAFEISCTFRLIPKSS